MGCNKPVRCFLPSEFPYGKHHNGCNTLKNNQLLRQHPNGMKHSVKTTQQATGIPLG